MVVTRLVVMLVTHGSTISDCDCMTVTVRLIELICPTEVLAPAELFATTELTGATELSEVCAVDVGFNPNIWPAIIRL